MGVHTDLANAELTIVQLDGKQTFKLKCPGCGTLGYLDDDQVHGRVSTECETDGCSFHETVDWHAIAEGQGLMGGN